MVNKNNKENNLTTYIALQYYNFSDDITDCICAIKTWSVKSRLWVAGCKQHFDLDHETDEIISLENATFEEYSWTWSPNFQKWTSTYK